MFVFTSDVTHNCFILCSDSISFPLSFSLHIHSLSHPLCRTSVQCDRNTAPSVTIVSKDSTTTALGSEFASLFSFTPFFYFPFASSSSFHQFSPSILLYSPSFSLSIHPSIHPLPSSPQRDVGWGNNRMFIVYLLYMLGMVFFFLYLFSKCLNLFLLPPLPSFLSFILPLTPSFLLPSSFCLPPDLRLFIPPTITTFWKSFAYLFKYQWSLVIPLFGSVIFAIVFLFLLILQHAQYILSNITTNEQINLHRYSHMWRGERFSNPFDQNTLSNCLEFWLHHRIDYDSEATHPEQFHKHLNSFLDSLGDPSLSFISPPPSSSSSSPIVSLSSVPEPNLSYSRSTPSHKQRGAKQKHEM